MQIDLFPGESLILSLKSESLSSIHNTNSKRKLTQQINRQVTNDKSPVNDEGFFYDDLRLTGTRNVVMHACVCPLTMLH
jgi:hypothetical protein